MSSQQDAPDASPRNIVQIIADDLGLMLGCYGTRAIQTPNIDKLAAEGTCFTHAFASTASCSGSRSTIYTGLHTHQNGQYGLNHGRNHFQTHDHIETLPRIFASLGYQTGIIAKVHVGPRSVYPWDWFSPSDSRDVAANATEAGRFFDHARETKRPFHLTVGFRDPHRDTTRGGFGNDDGDVAHIPVPDYQLQDVEIPDFISDVPALRAELVEYYKSITRMDHGVGLIMRELASRGLDQNTLVLFLSDNGAPFVNSKTTLYDAGVRLPLIVRQPGSTAQGVVNPNMVSFLDILPTCIDWATSSSPASSAGAPETTSTSLSPPRLGRSFLCILAADKELPAEQWPQQYVFGSHTFHEIQNYWPTRFMRTRRFKYHRNIAWKLDFPFGTDLYGSLSWEGLRNSGAAVVTETGDSEEQETDTPEVMIGRRRLSRYIHRGPEELFDLVADPHEVENLAARPKHRATLAAMRQAVEDWQYLTDDVWLMKDGASAISSARYQQQGLKLRDRFDFDPKHPVVALVDMLILEIFAPVLCGVAWILVAAQLTSSGENTCDDNDPSSYCNVMFSGPSMMAGVKAADTSSLRW
ncbi:alkaline-phosphatase-like protein [Microdochium trichocladiopsis]|uniref:Alkaline-phosphatase-like protein n=1 Tax=Microdochium trichocladiopsis TaxID=1682393 RepID=A0A9P9BTC4_9PEZI|nr:alkaline-phosphatase-like protein [Microdochium trichocladiopsis]KAH7035805.1 alkaline-phosphatase-like protein [Microdochium trichocladiopsis]